MPQRGCGVAGEIGLGVEGVNAVVFGRDHDDVVRHAANGDVRHIKRLGVDLAVNGKRIDLAERRRVHVLRRERGLEQILPATGIVVVLGQHAGKSLSAGKGSENEQYREWPKKFSNHNLEILCRTDTRPELRFFKTPAFPVAVKAEDITVDRQCNFWSCLVGGETSSCEIQYR